MVCCCYVFYSLYSKLIRVFVQKFSFWLRLHFLIVSWLRNVGCCIRMFIYKDEMPYLLGLIKKTVCKLYFISQVAIPLRRNVLRHSCFIMLTIC